MRISKFESPEMRKLHRFFVGGALCVSALASSSPLFAQPINLAGNPHTKISGNFHSWTSGGSGFQRFSTSRYVRVKGAGTFKTHPTPSSTFTHNVLNQAGTARQLIEGLNPADKYLFSFVGHTHVSVTKPSFATTASLSGLVGAHPGIRGPAGFSFTPPGTAGTLEFKAFMGGNNSLTLRSWVLTDLTGSFSTSVPEVGAKSGAAPLALSLGGLLLMSDRRRKARAHSPQTLVKVKPLPPQ
jgi:hypothetical protein